MTARDEYMQHPQSPVELATARVDKAIVTAVEQAYVNQNVAVQTTLSDFKRIVALYFEGKSLRDWCRQIGIPVPDGHHDHGGES